MPHLLGFLACEKVIFEEDTKAASLINILHEIFIPVIKSVEVPPHTLVPFKWAAFAMWYEMPTDAGIWYEQMSVLLGDSGEPLMQSQALRFQMDKPVIRAVSYFDNFPVYKPAKCALKLYTRTLGVLPPPQPTAEWKDMMTYPITIAHTVYPS